MLQPDPGTRAALQLVAAYVVGRRRFDVTGRFGLRATPGGFGTPAFGDGPEVVRVSGTALVHETGGTSRCLVMEGRSVAELARFVDVEIGDEFSTGPDTPKLGDPDAPLHLDASSADMLARWYALGWQVVDRFLAALPDSADPGTLQLWPEHFDAGTSVAVTDGRRLNVGFSPGDHYEPEPYVYAGPWGPERPGDATFWNAPFGAVRRASAVLDAADPAAGCLEFLMAGFELLGNGGAT